MELQHVNVKMFVDGDLPVAPGRFIEIFHGWIQDRALPELLIDVADYRHVPAGPAVLLVGYEADYSMDHAGHRWGLRYNRKASLEGANDTRFRQALTSAAHACMLLEARLASEAPLRFSRDAFELFINDRALAPNTPQTYAACEPDLRAFLKSTLGHDDYTITRQDDPRRRFGVCVQCSTPFDLAAIATFPAGAP